MKNLIGKLLFKGFGGSLSIFVLCLLLTPGIAVAEDNGCSPFKEIFNNVDEDSFYGAVLVAKNGKPICKRGFGYINKSEKIKWDKKTMMDTQVGIASVTKHFTAMVIMRLVEEGKLDRYDPINKHLTWYNPLVNQWACGVEKDLIYNTGQIRIRDLLEMSSGLPQYESSGKPIIPFETGNIKNDIKIYCSSSELCFKPGTVGDYGNCNPYILGAIIAKVLSNEEICKGKSGYECYRDALRKYVFNDLDMDNSGYFDRPSNLAFGYQPVEDSSKPGLEASSMSKTLKELKEGFSAGGIYSTIGDLLTWGSYLNKVLNNVTHRDREVIDLMARGRIREKGAMAVFYNPSYNGYGLYIQYFDPKTGKYVARDSRNSIKIRRHPGFVRNYVTMFVIIPEQDYTIIVTNNSISLTGDEHKFVANKIANEIIETLLYEGSASDSPGLSDK